MSVRELEEEIREELKLRWAIVSYNDIENHVDVPDFFMIENDIWESMHPYDNDPKADSLFLIYKFWSMGSPNYQVIPEIIHEEMPFFSVSLIEHAFERWNLEDWSQVKKRENGYVPQYPNTSILDVGCSMGDFALRLVKPDNKIIGIDYIPELIEAANFRKEYFLEDKLKENIEFIEQDIFENIDSYDCQFDIIFINFPDDKKKISKEPRSVLQACLEQLNPLGEIKLVTEIDDTYFGYEASTPKGLKIKRAYETPDSPVDTLFSRRFSKKPPGRPFYEITWRKEIEEKNE